MSGLVQLRRPGSGAALPVEGAPPSVLPATTRLAYVETYGCQMNVADTDMVMGLLHGGGYARTDDAALADLILINTCAVRDKAEERVYSRASVLAQHKARRPDVVLGITGCMAEHLKDKLRQRAPYVDLVVGPDGYRRLLDHVDRARQGDKIEDTVLDRHETYEGLDPSPLMTGGISGHITIQRGCDKFCTFCVVPYTRGRERGAAPREILRQTRAMAAAGYKEVQLLGQTVNSYRYEDVEFADLLRAVAEVDGIERIRFMSPYPLDFSPVVIQTMAALPKVCKHVHLPLQTASDSVLGRMRRGYTYADFRALVSDLRTAMPDIAISTDLLVGFCDETEEEFTEILRAQDELRFDNAFMFAYSDREGTYASRRMPDTVPEEIKQDRLARVIVRQKGISAEILAAQIGRRERVLVQGPSKRTPDDFLARTDTFRPVIVPAAPGVHAGALLDVDILRATDVTLFGRAVL